jgi:hypothetical protein
VKGSESGMKGCERRVKGWKMRKIEKGEKDDLKWWSRWLYMKVTEIFILRNGKVVER